MTSFLSLTSLDVKIPLWISMGFITKHKTLYHANRGIHFVFPFNYLKAETSSIECLVASCSTVFLKVGLVKKKIPFSPPKMVIL